MDKNYEVNLIDNWIENPDMWGEVPSSLGGKVTDEEAQGLLDKIAPQDTKDLIEYRKNLLESIRFEEEIKHMKSELDFLHKDSEQNKNLIEYNKWMAIGTIGLFLIALFQLSSQNNNLELQNELIKSELKVTYPYLLIKSECGLEKNKTISMSAPITNQGKFAADIIFSLSCKGGTCADFVENDVSRDFQNLSSPQEKLIRGPYVVTPGSTFADSFDVKTDRLNATKSFSIVMEYYCISQNCSFDTKNNIECRYSKDSNGNFIPESDFYNIN